MENTQVTQTKTTTAEQVGDTKVVQHTVSTQAGLAGEDFTLAKMNQIIWYIAHFIAIILGLRFVFRLLGANITGIADMIYAISNVFVAPFRGIFPNLDTAGRSFFDSAVLFAIVMYYLLAFIITKLVLMMSHKTE